MFNMSQVCHCSVQALEPADGGSNALSFWDSSINCSASHHFQSSVFGIANIKSIHIQTEECLKYFIITPNPEPMSISFELLMPKFPCIIVFLEFSLSWMHCMTFIIMKQIEKLISVRNLKRSHHVENAQTFLMQFSNTYWKNGKMNDTKTTTTIILNEKTTLFVYTKFFFCDCALKYQHTVLFLRLTSSQPW